MPDPIDNARASKLKAVDITIDSLKQYITISTVSIVALLAFYNGNGKDGDKWLFAIAVIFFVLCCVTSIYTINTFINKVHNDTIDVRLPALRGPNFAAIIFFLIGVMGGGSFFLSSQGTFSVTNTNDSKIIILEKSVEIGKDVKGKVVVQIDSMSKTKTILVNQ